MYGCGERMGGSWSSSESESLLSAYISACLLCLGGSPTVATAVRWYEGGCATASDTRWSEFPKEAERLLGLGGDPWKEAECLSLASLNESVRRVAVAAVWPGALPLEGLRRRFSSLVAASFQILSWLMRSALLLSAVGSGVDERPG